MEMRQQVDAFAKMVAPRIVKTLQGDTVDREMLFRTTLRSAKSIYF